jgi:hypothetical protein
LLESGDADIRIFYDRSREGRGRSATADFVANYHI